MKVYPAWSVRRVRLYAERTTDKIQSTKRDDLVRAMTDVAKVAEIARRLYLALQSLLRTSAGRPPHAEQRRRTDRFAFGNWCHRRWRAAALQRKSCEGFDQHRNAEQDQNRPEPLDKLEIKERRLQTPSRNPPRHDTGNRRGGNQKKERRP